jgi:type VI secretion system lysozyme-like protein
MTRPRLLERLQLLQTPPLKQCDEVMLQLQSILDHVKRLLGTHKGTVPISNEYGMPDVFFSQGINFKESSQRTQSAIVSVITGFEPRLKSVSAILLSNREDLLKQQFRIKGVLSSDSEQIIDFIVEISSDAKIRLITANEQD